MEDATFLARFEAQAIPRDEWTHRAHIRMAYLYLRALPFEEAVGRIRSGIQALNKVNQVPETPTSGYLEAVTIAWARLVASTIRHHGAAEDFDSFAAANPHLLTKTLLRLYYSHEQLFSPEGKSRFVEPDLAPLP